MHNKANLDAAWYAQRNWEPRLYRLLHVRRWKGRMPTYDRELFDPSTRSWPQIAHVMRQAKLVHETIVVLSFLPLVVCLAMGGFENAPIFAVTSTLAALFDLAFVFMQRYNRPRVLRITRRKATTRH